MPELEVYLRAALAATGVAGVSVGYELRRYAEKRKKGKH